MTSYLSREHHSYSMPSAHGKRKIKNFTYSPSDRVGKGYSSVVYRGKNENTGTSIFTQRRQSPSKPSTWRESRMPSAEKC